MPIRILQDFTPAFKQRLGTLAPIYSRVLAFIQRITRRMYNKNMFASEKTYDGLVNLGFQDLPDKQYWSGQFEELLADKLVLFIAQNLADDDLWTRFDFIIDAILMDKNFTIIFTEAVGNYLGQHKFAQELISKAISKELQWTPDCVELFRRMNSISRNKVC
jgi:hypothetical protein